MIVRMRNPFKPTAGMNPPELIGRDFVLNEFAESLDNGPGAPDRLLRVSGIRGIGKTVLLNALGSIAASQGFRVINVASDPGFCDRILRALRTETAPSSATIEPELFGVKVGSIEFARQPADLGEALWEASCRGGVFVTIDEVQDASPEEMRAFGNELQLLMRRGADVAFAFAGLPSAVDGVVNGKGLTFLQRAKHVTLERLRNYQVQDSLEDTMRVSGMTICPELACRLADAAAGYPFMVQLVGYHTWQTAMRRGSDAICAEDAERGVATAKKAFDAMVVEPALRRLPNGQMEYLLAMASCDTTPSSTGEIARLLGRDAKDVSTYRRRLIAANLIEAQGYGKVGFAIPYMRDYLIRHADDIRDALGEGSGMSTES